MRISSGLFAFYNCDLLLLQEIQNSLEQGLWTNETSFCLFEKLNWKICFHISFGVHIFWAVFPSPGKHLPQSNYQNGNANQYGCQFNNSLRQHLFHETIIAVGGRGC